MSIGNSSLEEVMEKPANPGSTYINCYVIASTGKLQKETWIKPYTVSQVDIAQQSNSSEATSEATTYSGELVRDVAFKPLDRTRLPPYVRPPKSTMCKIYVLDSSLAGATFVKATSKLTCNNSGKPVQRYFSAREPSTVVGGRKKQRSREHADVVMNGHDDDDDVTPPPVPPKPVNLYRGRFEAAPPKLKPRKADPSEVPSSNSQSGSRLGFEGRRANNIGSNGCEPTLPSRTHAHTHDRERSSNIHESLSDRETTKSLPNRSNGLTSESVTSQPLTNGSHSDTEIQMNYNISICSSGTLTYERCLSDENSYESVDPASPRIPRRPPTTVVTSNGHNQSGNVPMGSGNLQSAAYVDSDSVYGMYSEPYETNYIKRIGLSIGIRQLPDVSRSVDSLKDRVSHDDSYANYKSESSVSLSQTSSISSEHPRTQSVTTDDMADVASTGSSMADQSFTNSEPFVVLADEYANPFTISCTHSASTYHSGTTGLPSNYYHPATLPLYDDVRPRYRKVSQPKQCTVKVEPPGVDTQDQAEVQREAEVQGKAEVQGQAEVQREAEVQVQAEAQADTFRESNVETADSSIYIDDSSSVNVEGEEEARTATTSAIPQASRATSSTDLLTRTKSVVKINCCTKNNMSKMRGALSMADISSKNNHEFHKRRPSPFVLSSSVANLSCMSSRDRKLDARHPVSRKSVSFADISSLNGVYPKSYWRSDSLSDKHAQRDKTGNVSPPAILITTLSEINNNCLERFDCATTNSCHANENDVTSSAMQSHEATSCRADCPPVRATVTSESSSYSVMLGRDIVRPGTANSQHSTSSQCSDTIGDSSLHTASTHESVLHNHSPGGSPASNKQEHKQDQNGLLKQKITLANVVGDLLLHSTHEPLVTMSLNNLQHKPGESEHTDTYEEIDTPTKNTGYLLPQISESTRMKVKAADVNEIRAAGGEVLTKGEVIVVETDDVISNSSISQDFASMFKDTRLVYDKNANAFYIPASSLKRFGDPEGEKWFYPVEISSKQAALFLREEKQEGCFLVYRTSHGSARYVLSICRSNGDVLHYRVLEGLHGNVCLEGHAHSFMSLRELVEYFKRNKSYLVTRLRRPMKEARLRITPGYHYDVSFEIHRSQLSLTGKILGKGNFGYVCSGVYQRQQVAVKVLPRSEHAFERESSFLEEASILMGMNNDNIVRLIGVSCSATPLYIVTELMTQGTLKDSLRNGVVSVTKPEALLNVCVQVLSAMSYLEGLRYVLHRDLAARNFLITEVLRVKLSDFGRARHVMDDHYQAESSEQIAIKWAAPEVLVSCDYSTKSDVWAAGVVMWEVFSGGDRPYESLCAEQTIIYVTEGGRLHRPTHCPEDQYTALLQCWNHVPTCRPTFQSLHQQFRRKWMSLRTPSESTQSTKSDDTEQVRSALLRNTPVVPIPPRTRHTTGGSSFGSKNGTVQDGIKHRFSALRDSFAQRGGSPPKEEGNSPGRPSVSRTSSSSELSVGIPLYDDLTPSEKLRKSFRKLIHRKSKTLLRGKDTSAEDLRLSQFIEVTDL